MTKNEAARQQVPKDGKLDNSTMSTKLSTDQLICKTPQESPTPSVRSLKYNETHKVEKIKNNDNYDGLLYLGTMQVLFGLLMTVFGILVIVHRARMSQLGGGLWGGCIAITTGATGIIAAAKTWCPLRTTAQKVTHTAFLALSLISLAVSQLVLVFAATGLVRDINLLQIDDEDDVEITTVRPEIDFTGIPSNYLAILSNTGLVIVSAIECFCAAISSYLSSRALCPCFRTEEEIQREKMQNEAKEAFVNSWIGGHNHNQSLYIVAAPPGNKKRKKSMISSAIMAPPMLTLPAQILAGAPPSVYPLIPAPLGPVPSPIIHPYPKECPRRLRKHYYPVQMPGKVHNYEKRQRCRSRETQQQPLTNEDVVKTYTGLDRAIAEEFIEICDSRNHSLCSGSSCQSSCQEGGCSCNEVCNGGCTTCTSLCNTSDVTSRDETL